MGSTLLRTVRDQRGQRHAASWRTVRFNFFNQVIGGAVLSLLFLVLFSYGMWFADQVKVIPTSTKTSSYTYSALQALPEQSKAVFNMIKPLFKEFADKTKETIDRVKND